MFLANFGIHSHVELFPQWRNMEPATTDPYRDAIIAYSNDAIIEATPEGTIITWNAAAETLFGYATAEVKGRPISMLSPEDRAEEFQEIMGRVRRGVRVDRLETVRTGKDGQRVDVSITVFPISDSAGGVARIISILRDISRRLRGRETILQQNRELLTFYRLSEIFLSPRSLMESYRDLVEEIRAATGFPMASIAVLDEARQTIVMQGLSSAEASDSPPPEYSLDATLSGTVVRTGKPLIEMQLLNRREHDAMIPPWGAAQVFVGFPMKVGDRIIGSLNLAHTESVEISEHTARWIESLANYVAALTDRKRAEEELQTSREQLRELSRWTQSAIEEERKRIAREIHDELGQELSLLQLDLGLLGEQLPGGERDQLARIESMTASIDSAIRSVQKIATDLRPTLLDDLGLGAAVEWAVKEFQKRTSVPCSIAIDPPDLRLDQERSIALFRILQEGLTNVLRHARASNVDITLTKSGGNVVLQIRDDGRGISPRQIRDSKSVGLTGIRERVRPWGGSVTIRGIPGKGTEILITVPVEP